MLKHIPNALTVVRFIFIPFIIYYLIQQEYLIAFALITISGLTDILDGFIARKFNFITDFGKLIDPLADKLTQISILAILTLQKIIPFWMLIIILSKEVVMIAGASFLYGKELVVSSKWWGKLATVLLYIAIASSLMIHYFGWSFHFDLLIYYLAIITTIFSLIMYFRAFYKQGYLKKENLRINESTENKQK